MTTSNIASSKSFLVRTSQRFKRHHLVFAGTLSCCACSAPQGEKEEQASDQVSSSTEDTPSSNEETTPESESTKPEQTSPDASSNSDDSGEGSAGTGDAQPRDCDKIEWGSELKEGAIISRGDVQGFVDADKDGVVEKSEQEAGMCQLHQTGKKCGLVLYSRRT